MIVKQRFWTILEMQVKHGASAQSARDGRWRVGQCVVGRPQFEVF
jgi:hypothetical protein